MNLKVKNQVNRFLGSPMMIPIGLVIGVSLMFAYTKFIKK